MKIYIIINSYQFPIKQLLTLTIRNRFPILRDEIAMINASEEVVTNFILKYKDAIINDYEDIVQMRKNKTTKDIKKHWPIKITTENEMIINNFVDEFNKILEDKTISRIIIKALEFYYPEKMTFIKSVVIRMQTILKVK